MGCRCYGSVASLFVTTVEGASRPTRVGAPVSLCRQMQTLAQLSAPAPRAGGSKGTFGIRERIEYNGPHCGMEAARERDTMPVIPIL
jgi:hypothetical protein